MTEIDEKHLKIGNLVRFAHEAEGGPVHRVVSVMSDGMIEIHDMGGYFAPHLFVVADDIADIPPTITPKPQAGEIEQPKHFFPPFRADPRTLWIWAKDANGGDVHMLDVRGWGYLTGGGYAALNLHPDNAIAEQRRVQQFVVDALNTASRPEDK